MSAQKLKKSPNPWVLCDKCSALVLKRNIDQHPNDCPPSTLKISQDFIANETFYTNLGIKATEISKAEKSRVLFLSQPVMQLCDFVIGDWVIIRSLDEIFSPVVYTASPSSEPSAFVLDNDFDNVLLTTNSVAVSKFKLPVRKATSVNLIADQSLKSPADVIRRLSKLYRNCIFTPGNQCSIFFYGKIFTFQIKSIEGELSEKFEGLSLQETFYQIGERTGWKFGNQKTEEVRLEDTVSRIGGLDHEISEVTTLLNSFCKNKIGRGILLYGFSGTGKTVTAKALLKSCRMHVIPVETTELYNSKFNGNLQSTVEEVFENAIIHAPSVIFVDDIDLLCPSRSSKLNDTEKFIVSSFLTNIDKINEKNCQVFILATSNKPDLVDSALRRCGYLDWEIEIPIPNPAKRCEILTKILSGVLNNIDQSTVINIGNSTHGFVGSDLQALIARAVLNATKRNDAIVNCSDLKAALTLVHPSAMREVQVEVPNVKWTDIGGQENLKLILKQSVEWPLKHREAFIRMGISPPKGVLMFGPPGCSKTMIARALATESGLNFLSIKGPELFSKWVGESERAVRDVFKKARQVSPSVIFFDEIDALGGERSSGSNASVQERVLAQLLTELDGITPLQDVTILAATNRPDRIDKALLRPGRLDRIVYVPLPDSATRHEIFKIKLAKMPIQDVNLEELVRLSDGYSGAEVNAVCHEAALNALEEDINKETVEMRHFSFALNLIRPRTPSSLLEIYSNYLSNN